MLASEPERLTQASFHLAWVATALRRARQFERGSERYAGVLLTWLKEGLGT